MKEIKDVFLGGTCNDSKWRKEFIALLRTYAPTLSYFDPVVPDWTPECQAEEDRQKQLCKYQVYCITPKMTGVFSIAEMTDASNKTPDRLVVILLEKDENKTWTEGQWKSLKAVGDLLKRNGAFVTERLEDGAQHFCAFCQ